MADPINILSLYSGSGMHDEAVCAALRVLGFAPRVLGYVEREAAAAAWIMARMEAAAVEPAPVLCGDLCDLDARPLLGWVDLIVASPPCQPYSSAGKRLGNADARSHGDGDGPLPHTIRIIDECRPALVWFENVPEWVTGGHFRGFGEELCRLGYDIAPPIFLAAADVGAPHERERVFILCRLADAGSGGRGFDFAGRGSDRGGAAGRAGGELALGPRGGLGIGGQSSGRPDGGDEELAEPASADGRQGRRTAAGAIGREKPGRSTGVRDDALADSECGRRLARQPDDDARQSDTEGIGCNVGDTERDGRSDARRVQESNEGWPGAEHGRAEFPMFPPGRNYYAAWARLAAGGLDPACMPAVERELQHVAHGVSFSSAELLRLSGNAVVPAQAGAAFIAAFRGHR